MNSDLNTEKLNPIKILLAEDDLINQKVTTKMLQKIGYSADIAVNGLDVLRRFQQKRYDLILMDIRMPQMDGIEAAKTLTRIYGDKRPVIIAITADVYPGAREKYLSEGLDDYMAKPIEGEKFQAMLQKWINQIAQRSDQATAGNNKQYQLPERNQKRKNYINKI